MKTLALVLALAGCKSTTSPPPAPAPAPVAVPVATTDRVEVLARHNKRAGEEDLHADPVVVHFGKFTVTKAKFDPKNLEGGTATIELDLASITTGSTERDEDLKGPDYFDIAKLATATIDVANVKKQADATKYTADATVAFHGATKTYPVTFAVIAASGDSVRITGEHAFSRLDFALGTDPEKDLEQRIDTGLTMQMDLTLTPK